ncbi:MAG TPA: hypothetical protein VFE48_12905 [Methylomirabilota bacterium]|nr:hypothetical protein [Methylomirabilota bacterium]
MTTKSRLLVMGLSLLLAAPVAGADRVTSPYRPGTAPGLRGFSADEVAALRDGAGMGLARAAELNGYPGPRHLLDAVQDGRLPASAEQRQRAQDIFDRMKRDAQRVGAQILAEEADLEAAFRARTITEPDLRARVGRIAALQGELRTIHLSAHLATRALLTDAQVEQYDRLRGYAPAAAAPPGQHRH